MFQKTLTGLARPGRLAVCRPSPGLLATLCAIAVAGLSAPPVAAEETSREVRRYGDPAGASDDGGACIRLLRQRGVVFTRVPDKKPKREGGCGYENAVKITAIGSVKLRRPALVRCEVAARLEWWMRERVQPTAVQVFGQPIKEINSYSGYSCRNAFGLFGGRRMRRLSQHGRANALDIGGFVLENGEKIDYQVHWKTAVKKPEGAAVSGVVRAGTPRGPRRGWKAKYNPKKDPLFDNKDYFLRKISFAACSIFNKVFTPDWDYHHRHHIHIDLAAAKLCGYAGPKNHRMTAAAEVPSLTGVAAVALAAFRNAGAKVRDASVSFVTRGITRTVRRVVGRQTMISATEARYSGPDRGALAKARAKAKADAEARRAAAASAAQKPAAGAATQVASQPRVRRTESKPARQDTRSTGLGRVLGILLGRQPAERVRPDTQQAASKAPAAKGPVVGLGKPGGKVIVTPRPRGVGPVLKLAKLNRRAAVLLD